MYLILILGFVAFLFSLVLTPLVRNTFLHFGVVDHPDQFRKHHREPIPRVGGIAIAFSYVAAFGVVLLLPFNFRATIVESLPDAWKIIPAVLVVFLVGLADDLIGLRPWQKLAGQTVAASIAWWAGVQVNAFGWNPWSAWLSLPLTVMWLVACTNALNLIDGLDGLAAGVGLLATITVLLAALLHHNLYLLLVTVPLAGSLLGFLRYNFNPASVFLGDCGSLLIGFLLGCFGALWSQKTATLVGMTAPLMAVAIPLLDTSLSIIRRFIRHQPIFGADRGHIHHRLLDRGLTPRQVSLAMYGISGFVAVLSLLQSALHNQFGGLIIVLFVLAAWIGIQHLGYVEFDIASQLILKGNLRRIIDAQTRLRHFEMSLRKAEGLQQVWDVIVASSREFGFRSIRFSIQGQVLERKLTECDNEEVCWQLRIPLPNSQYLNLQRAFDMEINPGTLAALVNVIKTSLMEKLPELEAQADSAISFSTAPLPLRVLAAGVGAERATVAAGADADRRFGT